MDNANIYYRRNLPHYQMPGYALFITFRLANSLPLSFIRKLNAEKDNASKKIHYIVNETKRKQAYYNLLKIYFDKTDKALGLNNSNINLLVINEVAEIINQSFHYFDNKLYRLICSTIMPNHVHMLFILLDPDELDTGKSNLYLATNILQRLKSYTAKQCNIKLNRKGPFWHHESYDHVIRNETELKNIVNYILNNPVKANLTSTPSNWKWNYVNNDLIPI